MSVYKTMDRGLTFLAIRIVRIYRYLLSPILPSLCRFHPTCSQYALDTYQKHSFFYGSYLILKRLSKCHPLNPGGLDPVR